MARPKGKEEMKPTYLNLTAEEQRMLDELARRKYPGRSGMRGTMVGELIRAEYQRIIPQEQKKEPGDDKS